ncbi:hypothetical protein FNF31_07585 [Cafeteria roenbergensis]|uniref:Uncharacterized protein n=1 Tax=Cafeteria roenbergensis TaxID=33653 RepID=A0A5A8C5X7_CAFRO|nr:hypothetical protein FNF31_07585 [Cafeteria roenbergensis]
MDNWALAAGVAASVVGLIAVGTWVWAASPSTAGPPSGPGSAGGASPGVAEAVGQRAAEERVLEAVHADELLDWVPDDESQSEDDASSHASVASNESAEQSATMGWAGSLASAEMMDSWPRVGVLVVLLLLVVAGVAMFLGSLLDGQPAGPGMASSTSAAAAWAVLGSAISLGVAPVLKGAAPRGGAAERSPAVWDRNDAAPSKKGFGGDQGRGSPTGPARRPDRDQAADEDPLLWRRARALMAATASDRRAGAIADDAAAREQYKAALADAERAAELDGACAGALVWGAILVVKAANGFSETVKGALKIRDRALAAAESDPTHPVPRFVLGAFCLRGAGLSWFERQAVSALFGGDMSATNAEADDHLRAAVRLWDEGARAGPGAAPFAAYLPAAPWRSVLVSAASARVRAATDAGRNVAAAKAEARALLARAREGPQATADESAETNKDLDAAATEAA